MTRRWRLVWVVFAAAIALGAGLGTFSLVAASDQGGVVSGPRVAACYQDLRVVAYDLRHPRRHWNFGGYSLLFQQPMSQVMQGAGSRFCKGVPRSLVEAEIVKIIQDKPHSSP